MTFTPKGQDSDGTYAVSLTEVAGHVTLRGQMWCFHVFQEAKSVSVQSFRNDIKSNRKQIDAKWKMKRN